jgi:DNA-binding NarL/FixJ family response regulator
VTTALASGDVRGASAAAEELAGIAQGFGVPLIRAMSLRAAGSVLLAENSAQPALDSLRQAWNLWTEIDAPYEAALTRVLIAQACRDLADEDAGISELWAAREVFERLGAVPDLRRTEALLSRKPAIAGPLSAREVEVLRLVASGMTNREIAAMLRISEKTVARHLSNIFVKLDLPSRAAATAYAYKHNLV